LTPLPGFDIAKFPYVLAKESNGYYIVNPVFNIYNKIFNLNPLKVE